MGIIVIDKLILPILQPSAIQTSHLCSSSKNKKEHNYVSYCLFSGHLKSFIVSLEIYKRIQFLFIYIFYCIFLLRP